MNISIREIFAKSWGLTKQNFGFLAVTFLALTVLQMAIGGDRGVSASLINFILGTCSLIVWTRVPLDIIDGKKPTIEAIGAEFKKFLHYLGAFFILQVALFVGFILLIIPGIYLAVTYGWFSYMIGDKQSGIVDSFKQSARLVNGSRWQVLKFLLAIIGLNIVGLLALVVGLLVTVPMSMVASALVYRTLALRAGATGVPAAIPPSVNPA
jgi:hypothetical protein